jgi:hypothetical protein
MKAPLLAATASNSSAQSRFIDVTTAPLLVLSLAPVLIGD